MKPNVGMKHPVAAVVSAYTSGSPITYASGAVIGEAVSANVTWERADGHFYGDDIELDNDNSILGYTISFEPSGLTDAQRALLLGETGGGQDAYTITEDASPDVGFGYVRVMRTEGTGGVVYNYEGWWYYKLKFGISSEETRTKERGMEWRVPTLDGVGTGVILDNNGKAVFAEHKSFDTLAAAISYVNGKAGIT